MPERHAALANDFTQLATVDPESEFAHFLVEDEGGNTLCADRGSAPFVGDHYTPNADIDEVITGAFLRQIKKVFSDKTGQPKHKAAGELEECLFDYEHWVVCIRPMTPHNGIKRFIIAISTNASEFVYHAARKQLDRALAMAEAELN